MSETIPATAADADGALLRLAAAVRATGYRFTTVTPATHARVNARPGNAGARGLEDVFGWSRPFRPEILPPALFDLGCVDVQREAMTAAARWMVAV